MTRFKLGADIPAFKVRWRGYDRAEVEEYLREARLRESMARLDTSTGGGQPSEELEATQQRLATAEAELAQLRKERDVQVADTDSGSHPRTKRTRRRRRRPPTAG